MKLQIPGYQVLEQVGAGAMGTVSKARQVSMNRLVAVKVLHPRLAANKTDRERFLREARLAAQLSHANIIQAIDAGSAEGTLYFVMEYVEGRTVREELDDGKVYDEREAVDIALQVARALQHAARKGLVHRDVKPANIVVTADGVAKLADLGLARQQDDRAAARRERGLAIGTPYYISPEQIEGATDIDSRADVYALGATLYHMVTGRPPFPGTNVNRILKAHLEEPLTPPDHVNTELSAGLGEVAEIMLAKARDERYQSPDELIEDLEDLLAGGVPRNAHAYVRGVRGEEDEGEVAYALLDEDDDADEAPEHIPPGLMKLYVAVGALAGLLAISVLMNIILVLRR